jgi:protein-S-isoprenylcysteine O-methyltransferase Ste14
MKSELFTVFVVADFTLILCIALSILYPKFRIWPPPKKGSWQQWTSWVLFAVDMIGTPLVGILDYEGLGYGHWSRFLIGGSAILIGVSIAAWGIKTLTAQQSLGMKEKIVTDGPYQYTRNPQYVGFILLYAGIILIAYSFMALVTGALLILSFLILPFSEEPWLLQEYGKDYEEYCEKVPRFIGLRSFKPKRDISS